MTTISDVPDIQSAVHPGTGRRSGHLSVAGLIAMRRGSRTRLCHRLRTHRSGKSKRRSMGEWDFITLIDGVHQLVKAPIVLVWDRLNTHVSRAMGELVAERDWLTVFLLPAYSPDLHPVEWATGSNAFSTGLAPSTAS